MDDAPPAPVVNVALSAYVRVLLAGSAHARMQASTRIAATPQHRQAQPSTPTARDSAPRGLRFATVVRSAADMFLTPHGITGAEATGRTLPKLRRFTVPTTVIVASYN